MVKLENNYKNILIEIHDRVVILKLNRPDSLNALSKELVADMNNALNII